MSFPLSVMVCAQCIMWWWYGYLIDDFFVQVSFGSHFCGIEFNNVFVILFLTRVINRWFNDEILLNHLSITRVKKKIPKTLLNSASYATHKQLSDHSVKTFEHFCGINTTIICFFSVTQFLLIIRISLFFCYSRFYLSLSSPISAAPCWRLYR